ncbi:retrovirus-related pol polyprotein from transposon TNT 1-94 [Tanacetum coccineum]
MNGNRSKTHESFGEISTVHRIENGEVSGSVENQVVDINEIRDDDPSPMNVHKSTTTPDVVHVFQNQEHYLNNEQTPHEENNLPTQTSKPVGIALSKPARVRQSAIPYDLQHTDFDIGIDNDPVFFFTSRKSDKSEIKNGVDYNETFFSKKNTLRIILALAAHFDLELHQMDVKTAFLNGNIEEEVYMEQPEGDLFKNFKMKDMGEASYVIGISIFHDVSKGLLGLSSIMEAELVACYEATIHALWLRNFISGLGVVDTVSKPLKIYCDNAATIFFSKNDKYSKSAKHMDIMFFIMKDEIRKQRVYLEHISTDLMIANPLTKGLPP